jgi:hypothetical protein
MSSRIQIPLPPPSLEHKDGLYTEDSMVKITDIWFETKLKLPKLADELNLENADYDCENAFEWIIGTLDNQELNISRLYEYDDKNLNYTRIFIDYKGAHKKEYPKHLMKSLTNQLKKINISPIYFGIYNITHDNRCELKIEGKIE